MREDIITLDGPTSSGKNSVGFLLSQKLDYRYIDTGMIYRAGCFQMIKEEILENDLERILEIFRKINVKFENNNGVWKMYLEGEDVTDKLHTPQISGLVPIVAAKPEVREVTRDLQRKVAEGGKVVMGGRDIGSEIFPDAKYKFFLTASIEVRAQRRFKQLVEKDPSTKYEDVLKDMMDRDERDKSRKASPMRIPEGAVVIDNSNLTVEQTVSEMLKHIHAQS